MLPDPVRSERDNAQDRAAAFMQLIAAADVTAIANDTTVLGWLGRQHRSGLSAAMHHAFGHVPGIAAYAAYFCDATAAASNTGAWQALLDLRANYPDAYAVIIGAIAWRREQVGACDPFGYAWER